MSENLKQHFFPFGEKEPQTHINSFYEDECYDSGSSSSSYSEVESEVKNPSANVKTFTCNEDHSFILIKECDICTSDVTIEEMFSPMFCQHTFCKSCATNHYETQIKNFGIQNVVCPFPSCTDVLRLEPQQQHEYFSLTKVQLGEILDEDTLNIFERKLLDWGLSSASNFIWCPKCENGMFADNEGEEFIHCNNCNCSVCPNCKQEWTSEHSDRSCEEFKQWKELNDPEKQNHQLQKYLEKYGIECPECHNKFIKPSGGCLHLKCPMQMCQHEFCEGCLKAFKTGKECKETESCANQGFHAHHPRNCFYFLRDWEPTRLQHLLKVFNVTYKTESLLNINTCPVIEQKEINGEFIDAACGVNVEPFHAGFCRKHYVRYLAQLILKHNIDPVHEYTIEELTMCLQKIKGKHDMKAPPSREKFIETILQSGGLNVTSTFSSNILTNEETDDDLKLSEAAAITPPSIKIQENAWCCAFCTYAGNKSDDVICEMCSRTRIPFIGDIEIWEDGIECTVCTLINPENTDYCEACGHKLEQSIIIKQ